MRASLGAYLYYPTCQAEKIDKIGKKIGRVYAQPPEKIDKKLTLVA
jgi:hypothetical protein